MQTAAIVDVTLSAAQAALWDGRMTNEMLLPIAEQIDGVGFAAIDVMDPDVFEACVTQLGEDPWQRMRLLAERAPRTPLGVWIAGRCLFGSSPLEERRVSRAIERLAESGVRRLGCYDPFNDVEALAGIVTQANAAGLTVCGGLVFALSRTYDDVFFATLAQRLAERGCTSVALLDFSGILHPDRARTLLPVLRAALGSVGLEVHTRCRSGRAEIVYMEAARLGAAAVHASTEVLSGGPATPSTDFLAEHLPREGVALAHDAAARIAVAEYFEALAESRRMTRGVQTLYDPARDIHQLPSAMERTVSPEVRDEAAVLRMALGDPPMSPPVAAALCAYAARGLDDAAEPPALPSLLNGRPHADARVHDEDDDATMFATLFGREALADFERHRATVDRGGWNVSARTPFQQLVGELERRPWLQRLDVRKGTWRLEIG